jgi:hypothetical protein
MATLQMNETMSGFIELNGQQEPFEFTISVSLEHLLHKPQPFAGVFRLPARGYTGKASGALTFKWSGPRYELDIDLPGVGLVHVAGEKTYDLRNLAFSLVTCPLTVYRAGQPVGYAEVTYRDPLWKFPLTAFRLSSGKAARA